MATNMEAVQAMYRSFDEGDVPAILARLSPDIEWEHDSVDHGVPWLQPRRGLAQVEGFFRELGSLDFRRFEPRSFLASGDQVAAVIAVELASKATGRAIRDLEMHLWTFGADGKVVRFRHFADTHQHLLAYRGA